MEFLTFATIAPPAGATPTSIDERVKQEGRRAAELAAAGSLVRIWRPPLAEGEWKNVGLWRADDEADLHGLLDSLPMRAWMTMEVIPLSAHPNDPQRDDG